MKSTLNTNIPRNTIRWVPGFCIYFICAANKSNSRFVVEHLNTQKCQCSIPRSTLYFIRRDYSWGSIILTILKGSTTATKPSRCFHASSVDWYFLFLKYTLVSKGNLKKNCLQCANFLKFKIIGWTIFHLPVTINEDACCFIWTISPIIVEFLKFIYILSQNTSGGLTKCKWLV